MTVEKSSNFVYTKKTLIVGVSVKKNSKLTTNLYNKINSKRLDLKKPGTGLVVEVMYQINIYFILQTT